MRIFRFVKKVVFCMINNSIKFHKRRFINCITINQDCKTRLKVINVNSNNPIFYPFSVKTSKCSGSYNNINDRYAEICVLIL